MPENHDLATSNRKGLLRQLSGNTSQVLLGDGTFGVVPSQSLDSLSDVIITTPATGAILVYNGLNWVDGQVDLADSDAVTGILPSANGGTGADIAIGFNTYTPTLTNVANLDGSTAFLSQYIRIGTQVVVSGQVNVDPTVTATRTQLGISLPIASDFSSDFHCAGTAASIVIASMVGGIYADTTNNRAELSFVASDINNNSMYFLFMYRIV